MSGSTPPSLMFHGAIPSRKNHDINTTAKEQATLQSNTQSKQSLQRYLLLGMHAKQRKQHVVNDEPVQALFESLLELGPLGRQQIRRQSAVGPLQIRQRGRAPGLDCPQKGVGMIAAHRYQAASSQRGNHIIGEGHNLLIVLQDVLVVLCDIECHNIGTLLQAEPQLQDPLSMRVDIDPSNTQRTPITCVAAATMSGSKMHNNFKWSYTHMFVPKPTKLRNQCSQFVILRPCNQIQSTHAHAISQNVASATNRLHVPVGLVDPDELGQGLGVPSQLGGDEVALHGLPGRDEMACGVGLLHHLGQCLDHHRVHAVLRGRWGALGRGHRCSEGDREVG